MRDPAAFRISWRTIAICSLFLNLAAVATIATLASVNDAGALNTVALALAIIAFVCQLIIYSVQTWQSGEQLQQAKDLNSETLQVLADAKSKIDGTHQMVSSQHQELLHLAALKASSTLRKEATEFSDERVQVSSAQAALEIVTNAVEVKTSRDTTAPRQRRQRIWRAPITWPTRAETEMAISKLSKVDVHVVVFSISLYDDMASDRLDVPLGLPYFDGVDHDLVEQGLVSVVEGEAGSVTKLTEQGRLAGRVLIAPFPLSEGMADLEPAIREIRDLIEAQDLQSLMNEIAHLAR